MKKTVNDILKSGKKPVPKKPKKKLPPAVWIAAAVIVLAAVVLLLLPKPVQYAEITVRDYGKIVVALDAENAPITVDNFVRLVNEGFYDGLTFHRFMKDTMIQGGDPNGNGTGGAEHTIKGEFAANGVQNKHSHVRGTISMARATDPDSASSQFFITCADYPSWDGNYAAFGSVVEGIEVVEVLSQLAEQADGNGTLSAELQPVIESIRMVDYSEN